MGLALAAASLLAQAAPRPESKTAAALLSLRLELRRADGHAEPVSPEHVFQNGDQVRLSFRSQFAGYLYVTDQGSSGAFTALLAASQIGRSNTVDAGRELLVPSADGWLEVSGPAGFDTLYVLLSPIPVAQPAAPAVPPGPPSSLRPRCNDEVFQAGGGCVDHRAGPVATPATLPPWLPATAGMAARDLSFVSRKDGVEVTGPTHAPALLVFKLAHTDARETSK